MYLRFISKAQLILLFSLLFIAIFMIYSIVYSRRGDDTKVGIIMSNLNNDFFGYIALGVYNKLNKNGFSATVLNSDDNISLSSRDLKNLTDRGFKVIIFNPVDSYLSNNAIKYAESKGVKIITVDRQVHGIKVYSHIESNNTQGAMLAANYILLKLGNDARILELTGNVGASSTKLRSEKFNDVIKNSKARIIASYPANYDKDMAEHITYKILAANNEINAIFAQNDLMALGAANAAKILKRDIVIVGYDGIPEAIKAVKEKLINATIEQQPLKLGNMAAEVAMNYLKGSPYSKHDKHKIDVKLITSTH